MGRDARTDAPAPRDASGPRAATTTTAGDRSLPGQRRQPDERAAASHRATGWGPGAPRHLVGRDDALARVRRHLRQHRLVTVTGTGGVGKTTLALAAAQPGGVPATVVVSELAEVESADAVRHAVSARLKVQPRPGASFAESLATRAQEAPLLVLLDNCEHVLDAAADVAEELLGAGPGVQVLATSREPLRLAAEKVFRLPPLPVPASADDPNAATTPSVLLFAERAQAVDDQFVLDDRTLPEVARICRALDGVPLALEIAAARVRALGVRDIADRLSARFRLLGSGVRRRPDRHRSLRAVIDWSYELLDPGEQELFTLLAVYPGGFDLDAVLAAGAGLAEDEVGVIDLLDGLVTKSLVTASATDGRLRYSMLETLRAYGLERLEESGRLRQAHERHADHYAGLTAAIRAGGLHAWDDRLSRLAEEFDNVRAAVRWTHAHDSGPDRTFRLLAPTCYVGVLHNVQEVAELTTRALDRWPTAEHALWSEVAASAAGALFILEQPGPARDRAAAAVAAASSPIGVALGEAVLAGVAATAERDPVTALAHLDRADEAAARAGFEPFRSDLTNVRTELLAQAGRTGEASLAAERALSMATAQGNRYAAAEASLLLGMLQVRSRPAEARERLAGALAESDAIGYRYGADASLRGLAVLSAEEGQLGTAAAQFLDVLDRFLRDGFFAERWSTVAAALPLLVKADRREAAATLLAALRSTGAVVSPVHAPGFEEVAGRVAAELASPQVAAAAATLRSHDVLQLARQELQGLRPQAGSGDSPGPDGSGPSPPSPRTPGPPAGQTTRETTGQAGEQTTGQVGELRRTGTVWQASFAGSTVHLADSKGMRDLAVLLARPGREVASLDLATAPAHGAHTAARRAATGAEDLQPPGDLGERVDAQARAAYTARIRDLQAELDDADVTGDADRAARAAEELDFLTAELAGAYGMRGPRRAGDPAEKARSAVTARIRSAIARIDGAHPALGAHLARSVHTGRFCSYRPEQPTTWRVTA